MSGHSKWATIKRKKGAVDAQRGKIFTKLVREIMTAARIGGGDLGGNARLRAAVMAGKAQRMPADTIDRAIKKATGELEGVSIEEATYEGYGPAGVALIVEAQTDNRNRTSAEVRNAFTKNGGSLGAPGSVAWMFKKCGYFTLDAKTYSEDQVMEIALDAGADDVSTEGPVVTVRCDSAQFSVMLEQLEKHKLACESAELTMLPDNHVKVAGPQAEQVLKLVEVLEDLDDVQKVHANFELDEGELERLAR